MVPALGPARFEAASAMPWELWSPATRWTDSSAFGGTDSVAFGNAVALARGGAMLAAGTAPFAFTIVGMSLGHGESPDDPADMLANGVGMEMGAFVSALAHVGRHAESVPEEDDGGSCRRGGGRAGGSL